MPSDITIFAAKDLVFIDAVLALLVVGFLLYRRPPEDVMRWGAAFVIAVILGIILAVIGSAVISDPRPFTQDHVRPLIPHAPDNGFPSDHALLAAAIVAAVLLIDPLWTLPFVVLGFLVDWARVGAGIHHVEDVLGSSLILAVGTAVGYLVAPALVRLLSPYLRRTGLLDAWDRRRIGGGQRAR